MTIINIFKIQFILLTGLLSCSSQSTDKDFVQLNIDLDKTEQFSMSSLFIDVDYIPLETRDSCFVGTIPLRIKISNKYIYTIESEHVLRFHSNGSFDRIIMLNGRGPNELVAPRDIALSGVHIYVMGLFEVAKLSQDGNTIKKVKIPAASESIYCYPDGNILIYHGITLGVKDSFKAGLYDQDLNLIKSFWSNPFTKLNGGTGVRIHPDGKNVFLTNAFADTVFNMTEESPDPFLRINFGKFTKYIGLTKFPDLMNLSICNNLFCFRYLYYSSIGNPIQYMLIYFKDRNKFLLTRNDIVNDIDSGLSFLPFQTDKLNEENALYSILEPLDILKRAEEIRKKKTSNLYKNKFLELAEKINVSSNPVLMKCKLK